MLQKLNDDFVRVRITCAISGTACSLIAKKGYDPVYGARTLKRSETRELGDAPFPHAYSGEYAWAHICRQTLRQTKARSPFPEANTLRRNPETNSTTSPGRAGRQTDLPQ